MFEILYLSQIGCARALALWKRQLKSNVGLSVVICASCRLWTCTGSRFVKTSIEKNIQVSVVISCFLQIVERHRLALFEGAPAEMQQNCTEESRASSVLSKLDSVGEEPTEVSQEEPTESSRQDGAEDIVVESKAEERKREYDDIASALEELKRRQSFSSLQVFISPRRCCPSTFFRCYAFLCDCSSSFLSCCWCPLPLPFPLPCLLPRARSRVPQGQSAQAVFCNGARGPFSLSSFFVIHLPVLLPSLVMA